MKNVRKLLAGLLAAILLMPVGIVPAQAAETMTAKLTNITTLSHGEEMCGVFTLDNGSYYGLCAHVGLPNPSVGSTITMTPASPALRALAYEASKQNLFNWKDKTVWNLHEAASEIYSGVHNGTLMSQARDFIDRANAASEGKALDGSDIPDSFGAWISNGAGGVQELLVWGLKPTGTLTLVKTSANPAISNGNSNYTLAGAEYTVKNRSGVAAGILKTNANGTANALTLDAGIYTAQETVAPKGYALDPTVYTVTVRAGQIETLRVSDLPQSDPVGVLLRKIDKTSGDGETC